MAKYIGALCDWCQEFGIPNILAATTRELPLITPPREVDLCPRCDMSLDDLVGQLKPLSDLYERGRDLPPPADHKKKRAQIAATPEPLPEPETTPEVAEAPKKKSGTAALTIVCPREHSQHGGGPMRVSYSGRATHAEKVHNGAKVWEINWGDPDDVLHVFCTAHQECIDGKLKFPSEWAVRTHVQKMTDMKRIDV